MKKKYRTKVYTIFCAFMLTVMVAAIAIVFVQIKHLKLEQSLLNEKIFSLEQSVSENGNVGVIQNTDYESFTFADEVTFTLGIITAGISVFAIFGGVLSVFNVVRSKELDDAVKMSAQALENQQELECARLIQEGRMYMLRKRNKYAVDCYEQAIETAEDSFMALVAKYELLMLYADELPYSVDSMNELENVSGELLEQLKKCTDKRSKTLAADTYFLMGCVYGKVSLREDSNKEQFLDLSETFIGNAIKSDKGNVDFYRNLAITYALKGNVEKCKANIKQAKKFASAEKLYDGLVQKQRLNLLFKPSWMYLNDEVKDMLKTEFEISN